MRPGRELIKRDKSKGNKAIDRNLEKRKNSFSGNKGIRKLGGKKTHENYILRVDYWRYFSEVCYFWMTEKNVPVIAIH